MAEYVLKLDTLVEHSSVLIKTPENPEGKAYDLRNAGELTILDYHRLGKWQERLAAIGSKEDLDEPDVEMLSDLSDRLCRMVLDAPDAVIGRLTFVQKQQVMQAFTSLQVQAAPRGGDEGEAPIPLPDPTDPTGETP